jgi:hypothetical protein
MTAEMATVKAKFDEREFIVTDRSANLKEPPRVDWPLLRYLHILSQEGWEAVRGRFDGWTVDIDLERRGETPDQAAEYMMLFLHEIIDPERLLSAVAELHAKIMNELQAVRVKEGWEILAGPKHLSSIKGVWTVAIWAKHPGGK